MAAKASREVDYTLLNASRRIDVLWCGLRRAQCVGCIVQKVSRSIYRTESNVLHVLSMCRTECNMVHALRRMNLLRIRLGGIGFYV